MRIATTCQSGEATAVVAAGSEALRRQLGSAVPAVVVAFASTWQPLELVLAGLRRAFPGALVLGCSTAGELTERGGARGATAMFALVGDVRAFGGFATGTKADPAAAVAAATVDIPRAVDGYPHRVALLLLDPRAGVSEEVTSHVARALGPDVRLAGGAAADDLGRVAPLVGVGGACAEDALALAVLFSKTPVGVGVCHGQRTLSGPLRVTRAKGSIVHEVEGRPAWDVWREETRASALLRDLDPDLLGEHEIIGYLLNAEAGIDDGAGLRIRAPLARGPDGSLAFACGIPEGTTIRITESDPASQIESAREAARRARRQVGDRRIAGALVFDCLCRRLILGRRLDEAVLAIGAELGEPERGAVPFAGFECYGEIALDGGPRSDSRAGFHNTTTVVLAFGEEIA
jgi:methyl-accepting chemotaxis protein